jgi:hypothetical protein
MAGFIIGIVAFALPFALAMVGLGRPRIVIGIGGVLAAAWILATATAEAAHPPNYPETPPLWFFAGMILLLYGIWCGGLWLGLRLRRLRRPAPG